MIRYICNRCDIEIKKEHLTALTWQSADGTKQTYHYCKDCMPWIGKMLKAKEKYEESGESADIAECKETTPEPKPKPSLYEYKPSTSSMCDTTEVKTSLPTGTSFEQVDYIRLPSRDRWKLPEPMEKCITSEGICVESLFDKSKSVLYMDRMLKDLAYRYLVLVPPEKLPNRRNIAEFFAVMISFYRGKNIVSLKNKYRLTSQQIYIMLATYASMTAYERWFASDHKLVGSAGCAFDCGAVLAAVEARQPYKSIMADIPLKDKDQLFEILEYYLDIPLSEQVRDTYILNAGGEYR